MGHSGDFSDQGATTGAIRNPLKMQGIAEVSGIFNVAGTRLAQHVHQGAVCVCSDGDKEPEQGNGHSELG